MSTDYTQNPTHLSTGAIKQLNENTDLKSTLKLNLVLQVTKMEDMP